MKYRVLVLATTLPAVRDDGTPQFVLDLSIGLQQRFDVRIIAPRVGSAASRDVIDGVEIRRFAYFPRRWESLADGAILPNLKARPTTALQVPFLLIGFFLAAVRAAVSYRPHVIHGHWLLPGGLIALAVARLRSIPFIITVHGADAFAMRAPMFQWLKRVVMRHARVVGLTSDALREVLPEVPSVPQPVIPMGVDVRGFALGVGERSPVFGRLLFVGRLAEKKGIDVLLRAVVQVPEATVVIGGDGPEAPRLMQLARELGIDDRVRFTGRLSRPQLLAELRQAYAVVVPSRMAADGDQDTTPLVMSESMSAGIPVIASRLGGLAERIETGVTGLLADPDSPESLTQILKEAVADPSTLQRIGEAAQQRISGSPLDLVFTTARYTEILTDVIEAA